MIGPPFAQLTFGPMQTFLAARPDVLAPLMLQMVDMETFNVGISIAPTVFETRYLLGGLLMPISGLVPWAMVALLGFLPVGRFRSVFLQFRRGMEAHSCAIFPASSHITELAPLLDCFSYVPENGHCTKLDCMTDFDTLVRLGDNLYSRFEAEGNPSDLSLCIVRYRSALTLARSSTSLSDDARSKLFSNLANVLSIRFQRHGDIADLDHSVECHLAALDLRPPGHPRRAKTLSNFATALLVRFGQRGTHEDIELAIEHFNTALPILPPDGRLMPRMNYASALFSRFQRSGDVSDLNDAIHQYRGVVNSSLSENEATSCYNLANALLSRVKLENDPKDLELSIEYSSRALESMNEDHPDRFHALSCLSTALMRRYELYGDTKDLESAVKNLHSALELRSGEEVSQYTAFFDLGDALVMRYRLLFDLPDLELAIEHYRTAIDLLNPDHKNKGLFLHDLGNALFLRFERSGGLEDLEEAIQKHFFALEIHSENASRRIGTLEALGTCLDARFEESGNPEDLHTAIDLYNEALIETSHDHPHRATILAKITNSLERRFGLYGEIIDLDRSISYGRETLELLAPDHPDHGKSYQALASILLLRFEETGNELDLDEAYLHCYTSMNVQGVPHSLRAASHLLLARILRARVLPWEVKDIEPIFQHLFFAKDFGIFSPLISDVYAELASAHYLCFLLEQRSSDLQEAFGIHERNLNITGGSLWPRFRASLQCVKDAEVYGHRSGVDVYHNALRLLDRYILAVRSSELRQYLARKHCFNLAFGGAAFALRFQDPEEAIETLENGRSLLWSQLVRARTSLDELRLKGEYGASLADDFERHLSWLERASGASKTSRDAKPLLKEKEALVEQIRRVEGFKSFLKSTPFSSLEKAAIDGPIIILSASQCTCDAVVLLHPRPPIHVPLPHTTPHDILQMATRFRDLTRNPATVDDETALQNLLSDLWYDIVLPVVQHLIPHTPKGSRLWWCPTGVFTSIPLHAAGPYGKDEPSLSQLYVSSYTPTLQALIRARSAPTHDVPRSRRSSMIPGFLKNKRSKPVLVSPTTTARTHTILAIGHHASSDVDTCQELDLLRNRIPPNMPFRRMEGEEVSSEAVLAAFREPVWLHLACPASLHARLPYQSGFPASDGVVSLYDISGACPRVEFAFLSGRCSRDDDTGGSEEMMHLAASLQYSGVRSVVGTLWPVDDEVMQRVTVAFYEKVILKAGGLVHYTSTAQSLNEALIAIGKGVPLAQRIAFVHVGA